MNPGQFFHSYLLAFLFWLAAALGGLALTMLQHMTGGNWGVVLRRIFEAAARTLPWMALLFVPIALRPVASLSRGPTPTRSLADHILQREGGLPQRAVLPGARRALFRRLGRPGVLPDDVVGRSRIGRVTRR